MSSMNHDTFAGVSGDEAHRFRDAGVQSANALLAKAGDLSVLAASTGLPTARLIKIASDAAEREATRVSRPPHRHLWGLLRHVGLIAFLAVAGTATWVVARPILAPVGTASYETVITVGLHGLEAYQIIGPGDLTTTQGPRVDGAFTQAADLVGRYTLDSVASGRVLLTSQVSDRTVQGNLLEGLVHFTIPLSTPPLSTPALPVKATVYASPMVGAANAPLAVPNAVVLAVRRNADAVSATLALSPDSALALNGVLGASRITLAFPASTNDTGGSHEQSGRIRTPAPGTRGGPERP